MATEEERIAALEESRIQQEAASLTLLDIVKSIDGTVRSIQVESAIVDARLNAVDARLSSVDARVGALSQDVIASFRQMTAQQVLFEEGQEQRFGVVETKLDQILALLQKGE